MASIHQVNHPGREINISYRTRKKNRYDYYFYKNNQTEGIRLWNRSFVNGKNNSHKRKFFEFDGKYIDDISLPKEISSKLKFWGEYEGHSKFKLLKPINGLPYWQNPIAIHEPFFCDQIINDQNTDPFIFGDNFYYAVCKKSNLKNLNKGDIVLFGSEFGPNGSVKFYLDTLLVIKDTSPSILSNTYDIVYKESTLKRLGSSNSSFANMPIHEGIKFNHNPEYFSFFPASLNDNRGRPIIDTVKLGLRKPGARTGAKSRQLNSNENIIKIWKYITQSVIKQGFVLGTHANSLKILNNLP